MIAVYVFLTAMGAIHLWLLVFAVREYARNTPGDPPVLKCAECCGQLTTVHTADCASWRLGDLECDCIPTLYPCGACNSPMVMES